MSKVEFIDLPEGVQLKAIECLVIMMQSVEKDRWNREASDISAAFLSMYESSADVTIEGKLTFTKEQLDAAFKQQSPGVVR